MGREDREEASKAAAVGGKGARAAGRRDQGEASRLAEVVHQHVEDAFRGIRGAERCGPAPPR